MKIYELWTCIGTKMYHVSEMFSEKAAMLERIKEHANEEVTKENALVEYWVREWQLDELTHEFKPTYNIELDWYTIRTLLK